jgi:glucose/arabinose dehydrogenase
MKRRLVFLAVILIGAIAALWFFGREPEGQPLAATTGPNPTLSAPVRSILPTISVAKAVGWKAGEKPTPARGLTVDLFADRLDHPRWLLALPNGDVLVAESNSPPREGGGIRDRVMGWALGRAGAGGPSANRITLLRDADGDGKAEGRSVLLGGLNSPFGMALAGDWLYIANSDALVRVPFRPGQMKIDAKPDVVVKLPGGADHWARNVVANADGSKLYVTVGSASNIGDTGLEAEEGRAAIWEVDAKTGNHRIYAYGLRNPNGLAWEPSTKELWTVVNERDMIGPDLVPDYLTSVDFGGFYGWPWYYWGGYVDKRVPEPDDDMREYVVRPDYALGAHTAPLGLAFAKDTKLGPRYADGAFIGRHGSWNRRPLSGYDVIFVPFAKGRPMGMPVPVLTGFLDADQRARGRPAGVAVDRAGGLLVADDVGNRVWRVSAPH